MVELRDLGWLPVAGDAFKGVRGAVRKARKAIEKRAKESQKKK